ncbi:hypothetical protein BB559_001297 [Furculomyces boomerangus]|uniref:UspA domain-containing protein n=1 Tax=Furculomyces boomerangus TaxID=61424 RepID=A0A2T9Z2E9_9FUNG|nr:hypothetical protein BB559_001297 [Furculomyces boomerangus]
MSTNTENKDSADNTEVVRERLESLDVRSAEEIENIRKGSLVVSSEHVVEGFPEFKGNKLTGYKISEGGTSKAVASGVGYKSSSDKGGKIKRAVMVCINEGDTTNSIIKFATQEFVHKDSDLIILIHVRKSNELTGFTGLDEYIPENTDINESFRQQSYELLKLHGNLIKNEGFVIKAISLTGDPGKEIVRKSKELDVDHVIMGATTAKGIKRVFMGSVTDYCIKHCECSVTVVREKD